MNLIGYPKRDCHMIRKWITLLARSFPPVERDYFLKISVEFSKKKIKKFLVLNI